MKILKYKKISTSKYKLFLDNNSTIILYEDVILKNNLLINKEINENIIDKLIKENKNIECYSNAINYLSVRMRSKKEIEDYLYKKNMDVKIIKKVLSKLEDEGYINDKDFTKSYINDQLLLTNYGPNKIKNNLFKLGISKDIIDININSIDKDIILNKLNKIIEKQLKIKKGSSNMIKIKLLNYLSDLGYDKSDILDLISNKKIKTDSNLLKNEYNKLYVKYSKKYEGEKLTYFIIQKLYSKGYTKEEILSINNDK